MHRGRGWTFLSFMFVVMLFFSTVILAIKMIPGYIEYVSVRQALARLAANPALDEMTEAQIRESFNKAANVDRIYTVSGDDLVIKRDDFGNTAISVTYAYKTPFVANVSVVLDFDAAANRKLRSGTTAPSADR